MANQRDELMTVEQILAELCGVSERTYYRWRELGRAPKGIRLPNRELQVWRSEFLAWLEIAAGRRGVNDTTHVRFWDVRRNKSSRSTSYEVRWVVGGRQFSKTRATKALAESFLSELRQAAKRGEAFDIGEGLPASMRRAKHAKSWFAFVLAYVDMKWPRAAATTRNSMTDALATVTAALVDDRPGQPEVALLRRARELLAAVTYVGRPWRGRHPRAFFACMYFAALRPGEVKALRRDGCYLPVSGWGRLTLSSSRPQSNRRWTDSGEAFDDRGLKHRAENDTRSVPIPPELVTILREHIEEFGTAADGRLFRTATGGMIYDTTHTWAVARTLAFAPEQVASPLAARPYDLRHAAVSLWLNNGVGATEVANRAGDSVEVLLLVYAKCIDGGEEAANRRIDEALAV